MTTKTSKPAAFKLVFPGPAVLEEGVAAWCAASSAEYAVDIKPESAESVRFSVFPTTPDGPEEVSSALAAFLKAWGTGVGLALDPVLPKIRPIRNDWARVWRRFFRGRAVGQRLYIAPPWERVSEPERLQLLIDPKASFGTGHHPTTVLCIEYLETLALSGKSVLDAGCGSGVLSLAALLLGAERATGFDLDPEAVAVAEENARLNSLADSSEFLIGPVEVVAGRTFDLLLVNMLPARFLPILPQLSHLCGPGGELFLSGIDRGQLESVKAAVATLPLACSSVHTKEDWCACRLLRQ